MNVGTRSLFSTTCTFNIRQIHNHAIDGYWVLHLSVAIPYLRENTEKESGDHGSICAWMDSLF